MSCWIFNSGIQIIDSLVKKSTSSSFLDEIEAGAKLTPLNQTEHTGTKLQEDVDRGLDDLLKDVLTRFREDMYSSSDEEDEDDEDSGWSDD